MAYMLRDPRMKVFEALLAIRTSEYIARGEDWAEELSDTRPSHQFFGDESLDEVTNQISNDTIE